MTYPGGTPGGGYPGQGPQQPQGPGYGAPAGGGFKLDLPKILLLVVGGLGLINFFVGFADIWDNVELSGLFAGFFSFASTLPAIFLLGALFAVPALLPGDGKAGIAPAAFSVTGMLSVLFFLFSSEPDVGIGGILLTIFGVLQGGAAVVAYLFEAGIIKPPAPKPQVPYGYGPQSGQFPAPGQQPPAQPTQQYGQPGQPGQPGQQTQFAPQQGQFGQPGAPGTPPGGYPQQQG